MVSRKSLTASLFAGLALCVVAGAQQTVESTRVTGPLGKVHYDLSQGKVTKVVYPREVRKLQQTSPQQVQRGKVLTFNNSLTTGWFWSGALGTMELDWAVKSTAAGTGMGYQLVDSFVMAYATYAWDPSGGPGGVPGPGAETIVSMYSGTGGRCDLGTLQAYFRFLGLPGVTSCMGPGSGAGYYVTAFVADPQFCLPDGQIGVGYTPIQDVGPAIGYPFTLGIASTGPRLTNFGTNFPYGWTDRFDWWVGGPNSMGSCIGTYWFGGCNTADTDFGNYTGGCASFYLALREDDGADALVVNDIGGGVNPNLLTAATTPQGGSPIPRVGTLLGLNHVLPGGYNLCFAKLPFYPNLSGPLLFGELMVDLTTQYKLKVGIATVKNIAIPCDADLIGLTVYIQGLYVATVGPVTIQLLNTLDVTIGG
jgi:hypothetical protein